MMKADLDELQRPLSWEAWLSDEDTRRQQCNRKQDAAEDRDIPKSFLKKTREMNKLLQTH